MIVPWRVLTHQPADGAWNMAMDEAIARAVEAGIVPPTVRFYAWAKPTVSLGCLQGSQGVARAECDRRRVAVVRRPTGGRAVLHDQELTYSLSIPLDARWRRLSVAESFRLVVGGLVAGLRRFGVDAALGNDRGRCAAVDQRAACFQLPRMPAVVVAGRKLIGSAQRRWDRCLMQHGSILLRVDLELHKALFPAWPRTEPGNGVTSLSELLPTMPERAEIERVLLMGWTDILGMRTVQGDATMEECQEANRLVQTRYGTTEWTWRR